jgi:hypothetical protein
MGKKQGCWGGTKTAARRERSAEQVRHRNGANSARALTVSCIGSVAVVPWIVLAWQVAVCLPGMREGMDGRMPLRRSSLPEKKRERGRSPYFMMEK